MRRGDVGSLQAENLVFLKGGGRDCGKYKLELRGFVVFLNKLHFHAFQGRVMGYLRTVCVYVCSGLLKAYAINQKAHTIGDGS